MNSSKNLYHGRTEKLLKTSTELLAVLGEVLNAQEELRIPGHVAELDREVSADKVNDLVEANSLHLKSLKRLNQAAQELEDRQHR